MKDSRIAKPCAVALLLLLLPVTQAVAEPPSGGPWAVERAVVDAGSEQISEGASFEVRGTMGQAGAGTESAASGWSLRGGFWVAGSRTTDRLFKDDFEPGVDP